MTNARLSVGTLVRGEHETPVRYSLAIVESGGARRGTGTLLGPDRELFEAWQAESAVLRGEDGTAYRVAVTVQHGGTGTASFVVNGVVE